MAATPPIEDAESLSQTHLVPKIRIEYQTLTGGSQQYLWDDLEDGKWYAKKREGGKEEIICLKTDVNKRDLTRVSNFIFKSGVPEKFLVLQEAFREENEKHNIVSGFDKETLNNEFSRIGSYLSSLNFENSVVENIPEKGIRFTLGFSDHRMLLVDRVISQDNESISNEIIFSFFVKRELIASNAMDIEEFVPAFQKYLSL